MDDPYFDHKSAKRFDRQRASGPFGVDELLPKKITAWVQRKHPDSGKKQVLLNFVDWQRSQAARIIADFELYVYEWTLTTVKHRESLDKQDKRDIAQAIFARDRNGRLVPHVRGIRSLHFQPEENEDAQAAAEENLALLQTHALDELVAQDDNDVTDEDMPILTSCLEMTQTEFALLETLVRVFDHARSHFISEICEPSVKRYLNAVRIRVEENGDRMAFSLYRSTLLDRMQNSSVIDGLISYILKPRENNCTLSLWVPEHVAERKLLNEDRIEMSEDTWLELILSFVTSEERQTLRVPARDQRAELGANAGYDVGDLQRALAECDPNNFKRFRQNNCFDPVALRVVALDKLVQSSAETGRIKRAAKLELAALTKPGAADAGTKVDKPFVARGDKSAALPMKEGQPDKDLYAKFPEKSLRRRLWNAIVEKKCVRCNGAHLRAACEKTRQLWEDDFEKPDFWTRKAPPAKQGRVQLDSSRNLPCPTVLHVFCSAGLCLIDTCSDVSLARRDVLHSLQRVDDPVFISHLGGESCFDETGSFVLEGDRRPPVTLLGVFAVDGASLPAGVVALLGVADIQLLGLSLDAIAAKPGCHWERARPPRGLARALKDCWNWLTSCCRSRHSRDVQQLQPPRSRSPRPNEPSRDTYLDAPPPVAHVPPSYLKELQAKTRLSQDARTADRIGRLFLERVARRTRQSPAAPPNVEESSSLMLPRRGKAPKWYGVRVGRKIGICDSWPECKARVDGVRGAEFKSFHTAKEAIDYVKAAQSGRRINFMNLKSSKTSFSAGRALRAVVRIVQEGETTTREHICCLDSGSDVNLARRYLLHDVHRIDSETIAISSEEVQFEEEGTLFLLTAGQVKGVPALVATAAQLPYECEVLLGVPGVDDLGIHLDDHRGHQIRRLECNVGERTLRAWLELNSAKTVSTVSFDIDEVKISPDLPEDIKRKVRLLIADYEDVFAGEQDSLPKPFAAEPVELKFISDPEPQSVPEPRWTFAQKQILSSWAEEGLRNGSLELSTSCWASRPHIVMKTPAHAHKDLVDVGKCKLRVCGDYRKVNSQICKIVPNLPNGLEEVEKAAGHGYYWETDAVACYSQFVLAPGRSREALAIWSPIGLVQPTTLPFGQRNSGTEAQGPYRAAASELNKGHHGNYVDDWVGYSNDLTQLFEDFALFLQVCRKYGITLGPPKTRFGFTEAQFFGFRINKEGSHLALKHLDPIRNLVPPADVHELRRVLGLFVVSRKYIRDYAMITKPMTDLLRGKAATFTWGEGQQKAFDFVRDKLLQGVHLAAPNFELPFHLATDASEDGKGGELYQLPSVPIEQQYPFCPKLHAAELHAVIFFL
jgi:hypothetical protein